MPDFSDLMSATRAVMDPSTSGADLASIAQAQPSLRLQVAMHANAYSGLLTWLATYGDDATKQAVSARQQFSVSPVTVMLATRRRKGWLIAVIAGVVVIAVVIALAIIRPWQQSGPQLSVNQFVYLVMHNDDLLGIDSSQYSAADLTATIEQQHQEFSQSAWDSWVSSQDNPSCYARISGLSDAFNGRLAQSYSSRNSTSFVDGVMLFDTAQHASMVLDAQLTCISYPSEPYGSSQSVKADGVTVYGLGIGHGAGGGVNSLDMGYAQYGNVVIFSDDSDYPARTWGQWQDQAALFKQAVDTAAKQ